MFGTHEFDGDGGMVKYVLFANSIDIFDKKKVEEMKLQGSIKKMEEAKHQYLVEELLVKKTGNKLPLKRMRAVLEAVLSLS